MQAVVVGEGCAHRRCRRHRLERAKAGIRTDGVQVKTSPALRVAFPNAALEQTADIQWHLDV